jgi:GT2 family glycosyltransferase
MDGRQMSAAPPSAKTVVLEASAPAPVDWSSAELWRVIVTARGVPCAAHWIPGPGHLREPQAFTERLVAGGRECIACDDALERFRRRLGIPEPAFPRRSCSVIVCTHRRSAYLAGALDALARLDPPADEVIVVDNDPGELDCRELVEAAGASYVREDRRGLDNARTTGLAAARGDLVAFTDDDCIPAPRWLAGLDELFGDASVGAVTGPAFAYELESPPQIRFEREGGFTRGVLRRRALDWTVLSPLRAGAVGAGANMIFRRDALVELGVAFPPELDAGTPTESGGDLYALYRLLADGWRVVYDPGTYVFHRHRPTAEAMHRAFFGYGVGLSSTMTKVLVEHREPEAVRAMWWLVTQYRAALRNRLLGRADGGQVRVAWDYLRGGLHGPAALVRAKAIARTGSPALPRAERSTTRDPAPVAAEAGNRERPDGSPAMSVIVPTAGRPEPLARCLAALEAQDVEEPFEVIVIDDAPSGSAKAEVAPHPAVRVIEGGGRGAAAARNAGARAAKGEVLLFLDDDLVPAADLVRRHLGHHDDEADVIAIGRCPPRPPRRRLVDSAAALWWEDRYSELAQSGVVAFTDVLSGNASIRRACFLSLGGFEDGFGRLRREDWHWGIRALQAGVAVEFDSAAVAVHEFVLTSERRMTAAFAEGCGDALLAQRWPGIVHALPDVDSSGRRVRNAALAAAVQRPTTRRLVIAGLDALERLRLRAPWWRIFQSAQAGEYARGRGLDGAPPPAARPAALVVDALSDEALPRPQVCAPPLRLETGEKAIEITSEGGRWNARLAKSLAGAAHAGKGRGPSAPARRRPDGLITVVAGPRHRGRDRERLLALEAPGVEVLRGDGRADAHWAIVDRLVREAATEVVATVVPGTLVGPRWLDEVAATIDGDRVAMALGGPRVDDEEDDDLWLMSRFDVLRRYPVVERPLGYLAIRRAHYVSLGGFDPSTVRFGPYAPALELAERALDRGLVVAKRNLADVERDRESRIPVLRHEWQRQRARGALLARDEGATRSRRALGVARGAGPLVALLARRRWPSPKSVGPLAAYACGVVEGLAARNERHDAGAASAAPLRRSHRLDPGLSVAGGRLEPNASRWRAAMNELKNTISHVELNIRNARRT